MRLVLITDKKKFRKTDEDLIIELGKSSDFLIDEIIKGLYEGSAKYPEKDRSILNKIRKETKIFLDIKDKLKLLVVFSILWDYKFEVYLIRKANEVPLKISKDILWDYNFANKGDLK